jgi:hypothetical protein
MTPTQTMDSTLELFHHVVFTCLLLAVLMGGAV